MKIDSGNHLRIVREFIQSRAINGSDVTWGSDDVLRLSGVTVNDMEGLAQHIKDAVLKESAAGISASLWPQASCATTSTLRCAGGTRSPY